LGHPLCGISCTGAFLPVWRFFCSPFLTGIYYLVGSLKFDRCFVCGGASICVGCNDIPYSGPSCSIYRSPSSYPAPSIATWTGTASLPSSPPPPLLNSTKTSHRRLTLSATPACLWLHLFFEHPRGDHKRGYTSGHPCRRPKYEHPPLVHHPGCGCT